VVFTAFPQRNLFSSFPATSPATSPGRVTGIGWRW
jgi:hypothetical protein